MPDTAKIPLGLIWEEATAFLRAEIALILPLAVIGFGLPLVMMSVIVLLNVPPDAVSTGKLVVGPWIFWSLPLGLLSMFGSLSISALALNPGGSVKEALATAIARMPSGIGLALLNVAAQLSATALVEIARLVEGAILGGASLLSTFANLAVFAATIWLFVRMMPIWALLAHRPLSPWAAVRGVFALTHGQYRPLLLLRVVALLAGGIAFLVMLVPISAVFAAFGSLTGATEVTQALSFVAMGIVFAVFAALWTIYVTRVYVRLSGSSNGI